MQLQDINRETKEGKLLFAALAVLTTQLWTDRTPDGAIMLLEDSAEKMEKDNVVSMENPSGLTIEGKVDLLLERVNRVEKTLEEHIFPLK